MSARAASLSLHTPEFCYILSRILSNHTHPQPAMFDRALVLRLAHLLKE
jgi:hypothetical protein